MKNLKVSWNVHNAAAFRGTKRARACSFGAARAGRNSASALHLLCKKGGGNGQGLLLFGGGGGGLFVAQKGHRPRHVAGGDDGHGDVDVARRALAGELAVLGAAGVQIDAAGVHQLFQRDAHPLLQALFAGGAGGGDDAVPVADDGGAGKVFLQHLGVLGGEGGHLADGRILFEDDLAVAGGENFQRVPLADALGAAYLLGDDHPPQFVPLCQVGAKKFFKFFKKPTKTGG